MWKFCTPGIGAKYRLAPSINSSGAPGLSGSVQKMTTYENMPQSYGGAGHRQIISVCTARVLCGVPPQEPPNTCHAGLVFSRWPDKLPPLALMKTVLIIDDDQAFRSLIARWLAENDWHVY